MKYKNLTLNIESNAQLYPLFLTLIDLMPFIAPLDRLIEDATKDGPITIDFVNKAQSVTGGHFSQHGEIRGNHRSIKRFIKVVSEGNTFAQMFETLVFELCNAKNPHFVLFSDNALDTDDYDRDSYAFMKESAEYSETHVPSRTILKEIFSDADILNMFGTVGIQFNRDELHQMTEETFRDFDDWWQHVNQRQPGVPLPHAELYRLEHDRATGNRATIAQGRPLIHAQRDFGRRHDQNDVFVEVDIEESDLLAQAEILASFEEQRVRGGRP